MADQVFSALLARARMRRGLSQIALADSVGTTQRHLSFLETGRSQPGRDMVRRLANGLNLSLREANTLAQAAGFLPDFAESPVSATALRSAMAAMEEILERLVPFPAIIIDYGGSLIAANESFSLFTEGCSPELLRAPINVYRLALDPRGVAPRIENLPEWSSHILLRLRRLRDRDDDGRLDDLIEELESLPGVAPESGAVNGFAVPLKLHCGPGTVTLLTTATTFASAVDVTLAELTLETFLPSDEATRDILESRSGR